MGSVAVREKIKNKGGVYSQILFPLPTQGNNPWVDGVSYDAKLVNPGTELWSSINFNNIITTLEGFGLLSNDLDGVESEPVEVSIAFVDEDINESSRGMEDDVGKINAWPAVLRDSYLEAFASWESVANIKFIEMGEAESVNIEYYLITITNDDTDPNTLGAHQGILDAKAGQPQTSWINADYFDSSTNVEPGSEFLETAIHEIGHGIGMSHPHDEGLDDVNPSPVFPGLSPKLGDGDSFATFGFGLYALNQNVYTIMSYNRGLAFNEAGHQLKLSDDDQGHVSTPMALDVMSAQIKYGYNVTTNLQNNTYSVPVGVDGRSAWSSIWDCGGIDTIDGSNADSSVAINLRAAPMNAYRPQSEQMSEQYNWAALGIKDSSSASALQVIIDLNNPTGALLGTSYSFARLASEIINAPVSVKREYTDGQWQSQSFGDYFYGRVEDTAVKKRYNIINEIQNELRQIKRHLEAYDISFQELASASYLEQQETLLESSMNVGGYVSQQLDTQGGFTIAAGVEIENAVGGNYSDVITGNHLKNQLQGEHGNDKMFGLQGDDVIRGGNGRDRIKGGSGHDRVIGGRGNDNLSGGGGDDVVNGGKGKNKMSGGKGQDTFKIKFDKGKPYIVKDFTGGDDQIKYMVKTQSVSIQSSGDDAHIFNGSDLMAIVYGAAGQLQVSETGSLIA